MADSNSKTKKTCQQQLCPRPPSCPKSRCSCCSCLGGLSGTKLFLLWSVVVWCLLCLPGNIVTLYLRHKIAANNEDISTQVRKKKYCL